VLSCATRIIYINLRVCCNRNILIRYNVYIYIYMLWPLSKPHVGGFIDKKYQNIKCLQNVAVQLKSNKNRIRNFRKFDCVLIFLDIISAFNTYNIVYGGFFFWSKTFLVVKYRFRGTVYNFKLYCYDFYVVIIVVEIKTTHDVYINSNNILSSSLLFVTMGMAN